MCERESYLRPRRGIESRSQMTAPVHDRIELPRDGHGGWSVINIAAAAAVDSHELNANNNFHFNVKSSKVGLFFLQL